MPKGLEGREIAILTPEIATVWRMGGRRYFTQRSAVMAYARRRIREKYPCTVTEVPYGDDLLFMPDPSDLSDDQSRALYYRYTRFLFYLIRSHV